MPPLSEEVPLVQMAGDEGFMNPKCCCTSVTHACMPWWYKLSNLNIHTTAKTIHTVFAMFKVLIGVGCKYVVLIMCWRWSFLCSLNSEAAPLGGDVLAEEKEVPTPSTSEWQDHKPQFHVWHQ